MEKTIFIAILVLIAISIVFTALILREVLRKRNIAKNSIFKDITVPSKTVLNGSGATKIVEHYEVDSTIDFTRKQDKQSRVGEFKGNKEEQSKKIPSINKRDALFDEVARCFVSNQQCSISALQHTYKIGLNRAIRIVTQLENTGVVGRQVGNKYRDILIPNLASLEVLLDRLNDRIK